MTIAERMIRRPQGRAALSRSTSVKPSALPEVADRTGDQTRTFEGAAGSVQIRRAPGSGFKSFRPGFFPGNVMSRIRKAYEARFRALLLRLRARKLEQGVEWLAVAALRRAAAAKISPTQALSGLYERLRDQVRQWERRRQSPLSPASRPAPDRFLCDAGLGGLARWLRAAGYEAVWFPDLDDPGLLRKAQELNAAVLTTDSLMMERGILRDGILPALWLPPALTKEEQLSLVFREFNLVRREPRCMKCGGELLRAEKDALRDRIPPRTWRWLDEYFTCSRCGQLFWRGTHWQRISRQLNARL